MQARSIMRRLTTATLVGMLWFSLAGIGTVAAAGPDDRGTPGRTGAHIVITIDAVPMSQIGNDGTFIDTIVVKNDGQHGANDVLLTVPFDSSALKLLSVKMVHDGAWVTKSQSSAFTVDLDRIASTGDSVTLLVTFATVPGYTVTKAINTVLNATWTDGDGAKSVTTDALLIAPMSPAQAQVAAPVVAADNDVIKVYGAAFRSGEVVTFWYNTPTGNVEPLYVRNGSLTIERRQKITNGNGRNDYVNNAQYLVADQQGQIATLLDVKTMQSGNYSVVARGITNGMTVVVPFSIK